MVRPDVTQDDLVASRAAHLQDQLTHPQAHRASQHRLAVLRCEHQVHVQPLDRVGALAIALHPLNVPQAS